MAVGDRGAGFSISETADLLRISNTTISRLYVENIPKRENIQRMSILWAKILSAEVRGEWSKVTERQW